MGLVNLENGVEDKKLVDWFLKKEIKVSGDWSEERNINPGGMGFSI